MTLPAIVRIFFAIEPPEKIKKAIGDYIAALKKKSKPHSIRWSRTENLHITLQFIGEAKSEDLPTLLNKVHIKISNKIKPFNFSFAEMKFFPSPFRPRVIVLEVAPPAELAQLAELVGEGVQEGGYAIDPRPFRGHLTLGRIKQPHGLDLSYLNQIEKPELGSIPLNEIILFRSEPHTEGSRYTLL